MSASSAFKRSELFQVSHPETVSPVKKLYQGIADFSSQVDIPCTSVEEAVSLLDSAYDILMPLRHRIEILLNEQAREGVELQELFNEVCEKIRKVESSFRLVRFTVGDIVTEKDMEGVEYLPTRF